MKTFTKLTLGLAIMLLAQTTQAQYCMLPGRTPYASVQPGITTFKLNTIDRLSLNLETPLNMPPIIVTGDSTVLVRGKTYPVTIVHTRDATNFPTATNNIRVWIDYNKNFSFTDAKETVISKDFRTYGTFIDSFTVPMDAPIGATRLRATAKMSSDAGHTIPTSCDDPKDLLGYHGEMEDYKVIIQAPAAIDDMRSVILNAIVYPNPSSNEVTLSFNNVSTQALTISLFDIAGKHVGSLLNGKRIVTSKLSFNLNDYTTSKGIYFIKISTESTSTYHKIIKTD